MTAVLSGFDVAHRIQQKLPDAIAEATPEWAEVKADHLVEACTLLRDDPELSLSFLSSLCGVDRLDHFEVVYHLLSIGHNLAATLKVRTHDRENPEVPSVTLVWRGAHFQERETYDLMGIRFQGHPDLRRIFLWDGFPGHPLRKDWLNFPGGQMAGLERFPGEPRGPLEGRG
ncbi:MAG TPA: NADH-quinone oxidoreductase subunit C [Dehalococcoidia bacterium]|nr:NADH-quinone oxidoreductase subunit C [Dehalococcoidia bacterium]